MKRRSRELSSQMAAQILKHERAERFHLKSHSKKLIGFYRLPFYMGKNAVISIKQINTPFFYSALKKLP